MRRLSALALASCVLLVAAPARSDEHVIDVNVTTATTWQLTIDDTDFALKPDVTEAAMQSGKVYSYGGTLATLSSNGAMTMQVPRVVVMSHIEQPTATLSADVPVFIRSGTVTRTADANYSYLHMQSSAATFSIKAILTQVPIDTPAGLYRGSIQVTVYPTQ